MVGWANLVIRKQAMVTGLLLVVAVLAFAGLAYATVPVSTTQTIAWRSILVQTATPDKWGEIDFTITYSYTTTILRVESSTSLVPASVVLGLNDGWFSVLAIIMIGALTLMAIWVALKPRIMIGRGSWNQS